MTPPLIGITSSHYPKAAKVPVTGVADAYIDAVVRAGGLPVVIPLGLPADRLDALLSRLQGVLLTGGGDIDPKRFNGTPHPKVYDVLPERDELEIRLVQKAAQEGLPYFGICRGFQVVNVAFGGGLYTHILDQHPGAIEHSYSDTHPRSHLAHGIKIQAGSCLSGILGETSLRVNSLHHQGVDAAAPGLVATAFADDGLVEGLEQPGHPFGLAVQWHPEWLQEHAPQRELFRAFVEASAQRGGL